MAETTVTQEDLESLLYFWESKSDIESFVGFNRLLPVLEREWPEIVRAWRDYQAAMRTVTAVLQNAADHPKNRLRTSG